MRSNSQRDYYYDSRYDFKQDNQRLVERAESQDHFHGHSRYDSYDDRRSNERYSGHTSQNYPSRPLNNRYSDSQYNYNQRERTFEQPSSRERSHMERSSSRERISMDSTTRRSPLIDEKNICEIIQEEYLHNPPIEINAAPYFSYPTTWD